MIRAVKSWGTKHPGIYQFVMFNLLANIATITNFMILLLGNHILFRSLASADFVCGPFNYTVANGGLGGFLSFLLSYAFAQAVNFVVQRKAVFQANNKLGPAVAVYIVAVLIVYGICLYVPALVIAPLSKVAGGAAPYIANCINIVIQVLVLFPTMKFMVMKKT